MVAGSAMLPRNPVLPPAQDYVALKAEMIAAVQRLCPEWTDFNAHDPGVTLLELLCFALTDLGYRAGHPVEALLGPGLKGLASPVLFAAPPVTVEDFRCLLLDRVEGLGNVWLHPRGATGLHDIRLQAQLPLPGVHPGSPPSHRRLIERARRAWERHRPLCEDAGSIRVLNARRTVIRACVRITHGANAEAVLAQALFRVGLTLAPEPRRSGPADNVDPELVAEGPLSLNGMIAPGSLGEKPAEIGTALIWERIADVPGVLGVDDLRLWVEHAGDCARHVIRPDEYCSLDGEFEAAALPIVVERGGRRCSVDRGEVLRQLMRLWRAHRTRDPLHRHQRALSAVPARIRNVRGFAPLGPQLPHIYGLTSGAPETSAARELQAFLTLFEEAMRGFCEQLGDAETIGTGSGEQIPPRWLGLLLAVRGIAPPPTTLPPSRQLAAKRALLAAHATLAQRRGRGFDPAARAGSRRLAGPELRMRLMLGTGVRITLVEHNMLRPRREPPDGMHGTDQRHGMTISAVVSGGEADRVQIIAMLREEVAAHIGLEVHFVDASRWRRFHHVHRLWRAALRLDEWRASTELATQLRDMLKRWASA